MLTIKDIYLVFTSNFRLDTPLQFSNFEIYKHIGAIKPRVQAFAFKRQ